MVVDVCTYNGEEELWDIHYNVLKDYVDEFIVCEASTTFSGQPKPYYFESIKDKYENVSYFRIPDTFSDEERAQAAQSPNTQGAAHWQTEFLQKESIKKALTHLNDDDIVFIGDVDEIWKPSLVREPMSFFEEYVRKTQPPTKLQLKVYTYWLNNLSSEEFSGTLMGYYRDIKNQCLNHLRSDSDSSIGKIGWHFTSMGGALSLRKKLTDSYTHETYAHPQILENLEYNIDQGKDFLGRDFSYTLDESDWPQYLKENRSKYKHLMK